MGFFDVVKSWFGQNEEVVDTISSPPRLPQERINESFYYLEGNNCEKIRNDPTHQRAIGVYR